MRARNITAAVALVLALAAVLWTPLVVPRLVKLPGDFRTTVSATGTFEVFVAPGSLARLPQSASVPLQVDVEVTTVASDDDRVVIDTTEAQKAGDPSGPTEDLVLKSQYVLDRRSTRNVDDPRAWSMDPDHPVDRAGSYAFTFGFDFDPDGTYQQWDDSIGASYPMSRGGDAPEDTGGLAVTPMTGTVTHAADPAWVAALTPLSLPTSLDAAQWKAAGFDVTSSAPVAVDYQVTIESHVAIDDLTGATVDLTGLRLTLAYRPDPAATGGTPADTQDVFVSDVEETQASAQADMARIASDIDEVRLAERWIPLGLGAAALVAAGVAVLLHVSGRHRRRADAGD